MKVYVGRFFIQLKKKNLFRTNLLLQKIVKRTETEYIMRYKDKNLSKEDMNI